MTKRRKSKKDKSGDVPHHIMVSFLIMERKVVHANKLKSAQKIFTVDRALLKEISQRFLFPSFCLLNKNQFLLDMTDNKE